jgi:hypothetical protein
MADSDERRFGERGRRIGVVIFVLFFACVIVSIFGDLVAHFDVAPASGTAAGYISYQERSGIWGLESVCWRDTPYSECEIFDPLNRTYEPGQYIMTYQCSRFAWAWDKPSECWIVNATRVGNPPAMPAVPSP